MNKYQFRAIRNSMIRDKVFSVGLGWENDLLLHPIMGKTIKDIKFCNPKRKFEAYLTYVLSKQYNVYKFFVDHTNTHAIYVITKNDKIIYWTESSISLPAWDAWHILTNTHREYNDHMSWRWFSDEDFEAEDVFLTNCLIEDPDNKRNIFREDTVNSFIMHGKYLIDKRLCSQDECNKQLPNYYYHL